MTSVNATQSDAGSFATGAEQRTGFQWASLGRAWNDYWAYRETLDALKSLTDEQLGDIGIRRDAVKTVARMATHGT